MYFGSMKESYHICFTSHDEVMFRDEEDHGMFVNLMALRGLAEDTDIIVDAEFPDEYRMNEKGVFVRQSFMELRLAERYYGSPRNFLYQMNRLSGEDWIQEQQKDQTGKAITLYDIEPADEKTVADMLKNENGRNFSRSRLQDMDVCRLIDKDILQGAKTVYQLTDSEKSRIGRQLLYDFHLPEHQIRRCLAL